MTNNQNEYMTFELNLKFQLRNYKLALGIKRTWIIAVAIGLIRLAIWYFRGHP